MTGAPKVPSPDPTPRVDQEDQQEPPAPFASLRAEGGRVGTGDCSPAPLTEPDVRITHPALWIGISERQR